MESREWERETEVGNQTGEHYLIMDGLKKYKDEE